jgi:hypothetical protein
LADKKKCKKKKKNRQKEKKKKKKTTKGKNGRIAHQTSITKSDGNKIFFTAAFGVLASNTTTRHLDKRKKKKKKNAKKKKKNLKARAIQRHNNANRIYSILQ